MRNLSLIVALVTPVVILASEASREPAFAALGPLMEYRTLGASTLEVSVISLGTATFGGATPFYKAWGDTDVSEATRLVEERQSARPE